MPPVDRRPPAPRRFPCEPDQLLPARFAAWAEREPDRAAVCCGDERLSYRELQARVAPLAHRLRGLGVGPGQLAAVCLPRGVDLVVAVLAVACAGGGYVPVDRRDPPARVRAILDDAAAPVLLTDRELAAELDLPESGPATVLPDDPQEQATLAALPETLPRWQAGPQDVAYVIYTSGSTGAPKGVVVEHAQLARLFDATREWFAFGPDDVWTLFHSIAFDFSVWELWGALSHGGRLVVVPAELTRDPDRFRQLLLAEGVTVLNQTPSSFRALQHADLTGTPEPYRLRWVIFGGERLEVASLRPWLERYGDRQPQLVNMYGITETTVHVTYRPISSADLAAEAGSPIGTPIPDLAVRLVDADGRPVPEGTPGEMLVGGPGVARGYLNRPELTADRFLEEPGADPPRWYRTGDRARWLPGGELEYLGRLDDQVKIRGHRIELGEVEAVLATHPAVREAAVTARPTGVGGHHQLVAYYVPDSAAAGAAAAGTAAAGTATAGTAGVGWPELRGWLAQRVPEHLIPATAVPLDRLPLTRNGKVDRAALPAPTPSRAGDEEPVAARTDVERTLAEIWADVLGVPEVGVDDNFFTLGGDSILSIQVAARARRRGLAVTPAQLFSHQCVAELATVVEQVGAAHGEVADDVPPAPAYRPSAAGGEPVPSDFPLARVDQAELDALVERHGPLADLYPLAPLQRGLLFHTLANPHSGVYFEQFSIDLAGPLDVDALIQAWTVLHERHAVLRAGIAWQGFTDPLLVVRQRVELPLTRHDWQHLGEAEQASRLEQLLAADRVQGFDLADAPLTRLHLIQLGPQRWNLVWSHHHILLDRWSVALLIQEIFDTYEAIRTGRYAPADPPRPFRDYLGYLARLDLSAAPAYWRRALAGVGAPTPLGTDRPAVRSGRRDADYARVGRRLPREQSERVRSFAREHRLTLDTVLHAAWALLLAHRSGRDDVVFGVTTSGRPTELAGVEQMVGLFINTLPARVRVDRQQPVGAWLTGLLRDQVAAREFEHTPLEQIRGYSAVPPEQPLFESGRALVNFPWDASRYRTGNVTIRDIRTFEQASHALTFVVVPDDALDLQLWYDALRFTPQTADYLVQTAEALVVALVADPDRPVGEVLAQLPAAPEQPAAPEGTLPELVAHWAAQQPERTAVSDGSHRLSYQELDRRAGQVAGWLRELGVGSGTVVEVALPRAADQVAAVLGVLRAGAAYLVRHDGAPADPPVAPAVRLVPGDPPPAGDGVRMVGYPPDRLAGRTAAPAAPGDPSAVAALVAVRGPDGTATVAELSHAELARRAGREPVAPPDVVAQLAEPGSEVAAWELWAALAAGATLAVCPDRGPARWRRLPEQSVTVVTLAAAELSELFDHHPQALAGVRLVLLRGELPAPYARRLRAGLPALAVVPAAGLAAAAPASRLRALPGVREAVVLPTADQRRLTAFLEPDTRVLDTLDGDAARGGAAGGELVARLAEAHLARWRAERDQHCPARDRDDPGPAAHLRALAPARVLEVGCDTGLLRSRLLDDCERCASLDRCRFCLDEARQDLSTLGDMDRARVTLLEGTADDLAALPPGGFDAVIIGATVAHLPGAWHLGRLLDAAIRATAPDGAVVIGDVPHPGLREAAQVAAQLHRAPDLLPVAELAARIPQAPAQELLVDPGFLIGLAADRPAVGAVVAVPRPGVAADAPERYRPDLFRYDVVVRLAVPEVPEPDTWYDWRRDVLSPAEIGWLLDRASTDAVGITGMPDARLAADLAAARLLVGAGRPATAGELRLAAAKAATTGVHPDDLRQAAESRGWSVTVSLAAEPGHLDALFLRGTGHGPVAVAPPGASDRPAAAGPPASAPLRDALAHDLAQRAREALDSGSAPVAEVIVRDPLPRTADGRVDQAALTAAGVDESPAAVAAATVPPRTADEHRLARIWERVLGIRIADVRTSFFDLGGDSMLAIRLIDEATRVLGRDLPLAVLLQQPTIEGMAAAAGAQPGRWSPLVEITAGAATPFFCAHPAGGTILCYGDLGRLVAPQPFYALQARGVEGDEPPDDDLPTMAARYLADVRARQAAGPYLLGGWSMGGLVAYEMAQQLVRDGEQVGMLVLIDTPIPELVDELPDQAAALARLLDGVVPLDLAELRELPARERLRRVLAEAERVQLVPPGMDQERAEQLFDVYTAHLRAVQRYRPAPYGGPVRLLRAAHTDIAAADYGWGALLTGQWEIIEVPGNHESMVWPPNVARLAEVLREQLAAAASA